MIHDVKKFSELDEKENIWNSIPYKKAQWTRQNTMLLFWWPKMYCSENVEQKKKRQVFPAELQQCNPATLQSHSKRRIFELWWHENYQLPYKSPSWTNTLIFTKSNEYSSRSVWRTAWTVYFFVLLWKLGAPLIFQITVSSSIFYAENVSDMECKGQYLSVILTSQVDYKLG